MPEKGPVRPLRKRDHLSIKAIMERVSPLFQGTRGATSGYGLGHVRFLEIRQLAWRVVLGAIHSSQGWQVKRLKFVRLRDARLRPSVRVAYNN